MTFIADPWVQDLWTDSFICSSWIMNWQRKIRKIDLFREWIIIFSSVFHFYISLFIFMQFRYEWHQFKVLHKNILTNRSHLKNNLRTPLGSQQYKLTVTFLCALLLESLCPLMMEWFMPINSGDFIQWFIPVRIPD